MLLYRKQLWQNPVGVKLQVSVLQFYYNSTPPWVFSSKFILELPWTTASVLPLFFPGYFPHICLRKVSLFYSRKPKILVPFIQVFLLRGAIFYQHKSPFNIVSKIFLSVPCMWVELRKKLPTPFEMKLSHELI